LLLLVAPQEVVVELHFLSLAVLQQQSQTSRYLVGLVPPGGQAVQLV
jgi:hypothetical protein